MVNLKRYLAITLIAIFTLSTTATLAMAHCGGSSPQSETFQIEKKMDGCNHTHSTTEDNHNNTNEKIQDNNDHNGHTGDTDSSGENQQTSCTNCDAGFCKTQSVTATKTTAAFHAPSSNLHTEKDINLSSIFLSIIPEPPKSIS
jgi:hypothetical protein